MVTAMRIWISQSLSIFLQKPSVDTSTPSRNRELLQAWAAVLCSSAFDVLASQESQHFKDWTTKGVRSQCMAPTSNSCL